MCTSASDAMSNAGGPPTAGACNVRWVMPGIRRASPSERHGDPRKASSAPLECTFSKPTFAGEPLNHDPALECLHDRKADCRQVPRPSHGQRGTGGGERRWQPPMEPHGIVILIITILSALASRSW
jgi:hypothetical protein